MPTRCNADKVWDTASLENWGTVARQRMTDCVACRNGAELGFEFTMAFQPIVDLKSDRVWGYEALVRGTSGQGAGHVLAQVNEQTRYVFDQACRVKAIELAGRLLPDDDSRVSINFMPNAVYEPRACIRASLQAADRVDLNRQRLMFEFTENERMPDVAHVKKIIAEYRQIGFTTALDDFGAGYAGLSLLAQFRPDIIKLDMELIRGIDTETPKQTIIKGVMAMAAGLGVTVLAEGIESEEESTFLYSIGIALQQGYWFARPAVERLPLVESLGRAKLVA